MKTELQAAKEWVQNLEIDEINIISTKYRLYFDSSDELHLEVFRKEVIDTWWKIVYSKNGANIADWTFFLGKYFPKVTGIITYEMKFEIYSKEVLNQPPEKMEYKDTRKGERPKIKDFFPETFTLQDVLPIYESQPELFKYAQALDAYIDELESQSPETKEPESEFPMCTKMAFEDLESRLTELMADFLDEENTIMQESFGNLKDPVKREESELHVRMAKLAMMEYKKTMTKPLNK